jgi:hypothetical protein
MRLILLFAWALGASDLARAQVTHPLVQCVALLTDPNFAAVGRSRGSVDAQPLPADLPPVHHLFPHEPTYEDHLELLRLLVENDQYKLRINEFHREFVGPGEVAGYLDSVRAEIPNLVAAGRARGMRAPSFWNLARIGGAAVTLGLPPLFAGITALMIHDFVHEPWLFKVFVVPYSAAMGGLAWLSRGHFRKVGRALGAVDPRDWRSWIKAFEFELPSAFDQFLEGRFDAIGDTAGLHVAGPTIDCATTPEVCALLIDQPGPGAHAQELANYRELLGRAVVTSINDGPDLDPDLWRLIFVSFRVFKHPETHQPHLIVSGRILKLVHADDGPRRRRPVEVPRAAAAEDLGGLWPTPAR